MDNKSGVNINLLEIRQAKKIDRDFIEKVVKLNSD